uniref:Ovule protein n=1 Tax=Heterorhabditis bacteriophora TaxID=37862 RepID=A0A1I7WKG4_HETBA
MNSGPYGIQIVRRIGSMICCMRSFKYINYNYVSVIKTPSIFSHQISCRLEYKRIIPEHQCLRKHPLLSVHHLRTMESHHLSSEGSTQSYQIYHCWWVFIASIMKLFLFKMLDNLTTVGNGNDINNL